MRASDKQWMDNYDHYYFDVHVICLILVTIWVMHFWREFFELSLSLLLFIFANAECCQSLVPAKTSLLTTHNISKTPPATKNHCNIMRIVVDGDRREVDGSDDK
jgi:hypothetical protein